MWRAVSILALIAACGGSPGGRTETAGSAPAIGAFIPEPPPCPAPPGLARVHELGAWVEASGEVGRAAAEHVARGLAEAERRGDGDGAGVACLEDKREAISHTRRRMAAEKMMVSGMGGERAVVRVRMGCLRIQRLVEEARRCSP